MTPEIDPDELKLYHDYVYRTPEQVKAKELVDKFRNEFKWVEKDYPIDLYRDTKQCAIIAVELRLEHDFWMDEDYAKHLGESLEGTEEFWEQVKEEINKL